ncbi:MAG TPA: phosphatidate cytidylyltransferase [Pseudomonadales bacterium]|nr:phosphatidate cytidylyltransferase [Pseudomonadales bacterium]
MLKQRVITAIILAVVLVAAIAMLPPVGFYFLVGAVFTVAAWEWAQLAGIVDSRQRLIYAALVAVAGVVFADRLNIMQGLAPTIEPVLSANLALWVFLMFLVITYPKTTVLWRSPFLRAALGAALLICTALALCYLRQHEYWFAMVIYTLLVVVCADTGAYFAGVNFGRRKLLPMVSPGKTWEGFIGGLCANVVLALTTSIWVEAASPALLLIVTLIASVLSVLGDLTESMLKRHAGVKDSSQLLPGHGGVLDRIDSVMAAAPVIAIGVLLHGQLS